MARSQAKFEIVKYKGKYRWRLVVRGQPVAASMKGYLSESHVRQAVEALKKNVALAEIVGKSSE